MSLRYKVVAFGLVLLFTFQSLNEINRHSYTTGICNFKSYKPAGITDCFGLYNGTSLNNCGHAFHTN
ncbi:MAG: hypothetical protein ACJARX_000075 [Psychroserpens sp.]|jgi:hypothetical protein